MKNSKMTISQLAKAGRVNAETIRYYQRLGLLPIPSGTGAYRIYDGRILQQLNFIRKAKQVGFSLKEIKQLIQLDPNKDHSHIQKMTQMKLDELKNQINGLHEIYQTLADLITKCNQDVHERSCPIIKTLESE